MSEVKTEDNHNNDEEKEKEKEEDSNSLSTIKAKVEWTTWEELLLACAVKRHGFKDWDSVAMELQTRCFPTATTTTTTDGLTPQTCRDKFRDLQRRFTESNDNVKAVEDDGGDDVTVPWLEELRKLRVAELKQEVHRYDLSIQSLQLKVKRLEEERERSSKENDGNDDVKTDLEKDKNTANLVKCEDEERSENDKKGGDLPPVTGKSVSGDDENRSFNESNSTDNRGTGSKAEPEPVEDVKPETVEELKPAPVGGEDSCNDSSDRGKASQEGKVDSAELRDSVDESKEVTTTKENSDVQSSASLTRKRRRKGGQGDSDTGGGGKGGGGDGGVDAATPTTTTTTTGATRREVVVVKSEPLIGFLDIIRSQKHGLMFERRLDVQNADKYKNMVRQHVDLQTIQNRLDDGSYSSCSNKFYLDLLLVFNNAIVFFPKSSPESLAAHELRDIVMKEIKKNRNQTSDPPPEPASAKVQLKPDTDRSGSGSDSLLAKHKSTAPLVVCKKRSSIAAKASSSSAAAKVEKVEKLADNKPLLNSKPAVKSSSSTQNEDDSSIKLKLKEKPVTGVRSMRRSSKGRPNSNTTTPSNTNSNQNTTSSSSQQQQPGSARKSDDAKSDKKKPELNNAAAKKRGAADFLKRMKKNSPGKGSSVESLIGSTDNSKGGKSDQQKKKVDERKDTGPLRRSGNGNGRQAKEDNSPSKRSVGRPPKKGKDAPAGKRGREGGEGEGSSKRPNKRSRR